MKHRQPLLQLALILTALSLQVACGASTTESQHGSISALSAASEAPDDLCEHEVPRDVCVKCIPELAEGFKAVNDWCGPHEVPESQCHACHPNLSFDPLPELEEGADMQDLTREQAAAGLEDHLVAGKVTVIDFHAPWCVPCRDMEGHLRRLVNAREDVAVRRVKVDDWDDPLAVQHLGTASGLPFVIVYDAQGARVGDISGMEPAALDALLEEAAP